MSDKMTNRNKFLVVFLALVAPALSESCDNDSMRLCSTSIEPGIEVVVRDASTHQSIAEGSTGYVRDGAYADTLQPYGMSSSGVLGSFRAADERPGSYEVVVQHEGYREWRKTDVPVYPGECHVSTTHVVALMDSL